jgi:uncharacterized membrane protein YdfJ with MMPL/SSD domain
VPLKRSTSPSKNVRGKVSEEVLLRDIERREHWAKAFKYFVVCTGVALIVLATWPVAYVLRGQETVLNVNIALGLTVTVSIAGLAATGWGLTQKRRADRLNQRNKDLSRDVKELQTRLRENHLNDQVSR